MCLKTDDLFLFLSTVIHVHDPFHSFFSLLTMLI